MKTTAHNQKGFTLIELIMVIVILGILAAVAIPKFTDLSTSAKNSRRDGVEGALASAITIKHTDLLLNSSEYHAAEVASGVDVSGVTLSVSGGSIQAAFDDGSACYGYTDHVGAGTAGQLGGGADGSC